MVVNCLSFCRKHGIKGWRFRVWESWVSSVPEEHGTKRHKEISPGGLKSLKDEALGTGGIMGWKVGALPETCRGLEVFFYFSKW